MEQFANGTPASHLGDVEWRKATRSGPSGDCVEVTALPDWQVGMRNSRAGEFDDLTV